MSGINKRSIPQRAYVVHECCGELGCVWNGAWHKEPTAHGCMKYTTLDACDHVETIEYLESIGYKEDFSKLKELQARWGIYHDD